MTLEAATRQTAHTSLFRRRVQARAGTAALTGWAVEQLNHRGFYGAWAEAPADGAPDEAVTLEELVVLLTMPQADADPRLWKLVVRTIQRGPIDVRRLARLARQERAEGLLAWLLEGLPAEEATDTTRALRAALHPRDARAPDVRYDFERLRRRPASKERLWRRPPG